MQGLRGVHRALEEQVARQVPPDLGPVCELSGPELLEAEEREVARLLVLAAVGSYAGGGPPVTGALLAVSSRYQERSFLCTGRSLPRAGELIGLLDAAVAARSPRLLAEVADHLGQGWPGYPDSVFPAALAALAARLDPAGAAGPGSDRDAGATTPGSGTVSAPRLSSPPDPAPLPSPGPGPGPLPCPARGSSP
ncbi:hypothetical protein SMD11_0252 [Streptomyces albireticuli]|uniref:Uncharacterized protein n=1 Tax=Streptomyces albireticuli TaxID=1940 RepID=A0A1Z2KV38_9ACTN|nr:hypothetical protein [Streptomyces albireticuli]ARZ65918.1 hypothetical protein SMD11_0252 [Streptomyces albireticuli]